MGSCETGSISAIDAGIYSNKLKEAHANQSLDDYIVIKASDMRRKPKKGKEQPLSKTDQDYVFQNCGDNRLERNGGGMGGHFVDPLLKLCQNISQSGSFMKESHLCK